MKITEEIFESICSDIEQTHEGVGKICQSHKVDKKQFFKLVKEDEEKRNRYARAKSDQADYLAELMLEVAFDDVDDELPFVGVNHIQRDRLKVDTLKFIAAKLKPSKYGDKVDVTSGGEPVKAVIVNLGGGVNPNETTE